MLFAAKSRVLELETTLKHLQTDHLALATRVAQLEANWEAERLKLTNAKDLMARAAARLERSTSRSEPQDNGDEPPPGSAPIDPSHLTNPFARQMLQPRGG